MGFSDTTAAERGSQVPRVLVVDDDQSTRLLFTRGLERAGFDVAVASDGAIALKLLRHASFDVLLLDSIMPGLSGREVLAHVRADLRHPSLPVMFVTGESSESRHAARGLDGPDDYLTKPVDIDQLAARLRALVRPDEGEARIRRTIETAGDAFVAWDDTGVILEWDAQACAIFGWPRDAVLGQDVATTMISPSSRDAFERAIRACLAIDAAPGPTAEVELVGLLRDGREIAIRLTAWAVRIGDRYTVSALVKSVTARRDLECSLRTSDRLQGLMDATLDVCTLTDMAGTILYVSPSCRTLGYDPESLVGTAGRAMVHPDDCGQLAAMRAAAFGPDGPTTQVLRIRAKSGSYIWMEVTGTAVRPAPGREPTGFQTVGHDVTRRHAEERDREEAAARLGTTNRGLAGALVREQDMVRELGDLLKLKDEFVAMVSHELRTPLTSIVGYAEMLDDGELGELLDDQHRVLIIMDQNARRLVALVEDLLTIGRIEAGSFESTRAPLPLGPMIEAAGKTMLPNARTKGVVLELDVSPELGNVCADAGQIDRVLLNLLSNAVKFTAKGGRVAVRAQPTSADEVEIAVEDNGVGIPIGEQSQVFLRFFRAHQTVVDEVPGTGLGLAIVKSIVEQHEGRIALVSDPDHGTSVTVTLPRALDSDLVLTEGPHVSEPSHSKFETRHHEQHRIGSRRR